MIDRVVQKNYSFLYSNRRTRTMPNLTDKSILKKKSGSNSSTIEKLREAYEIGLIIDSSDKNSH